MKTLKLNYMVKLNFWEKWFVFWGMPFLLNINTLEVHDLRKLTKSCSIAQMADHNKRYLTTHNFETAITKGIVINGTWKMANGCRWCLKKHDTG